MNWAVLAAIGSLGSLVVTIAAGIYTAGKLTQRVDDNTKRTDVHERRLDEHGRAIGDLDVRVGQFDKWTEGYNAASRVSVSREPNPILQGGSGEAIRL